MYSGYFNQRVFNQQYINPVYYAQTQQSIMQYNFQQNQEIVKAVNAVHDLCEAVSNLDEEHQKIAFFACLSELAKHYKWEG